MFNFYYIVNYSKSKVLNKRLLFRLTRLVFDIVLNNIPDWKIVKASDWKIVKV